MTSILKVDTIQDTAGNNIINESGDTITIGASGDTVNVVGTLQNNGSGLISGITMVDQWRITTTINGDHGDIVANLERNDTSGYGGIGTGMTESSGIFTFPSTGIYLVLVQGAWFSSSGAIGFMSVATKYTINNSTYATHSNIYDSASTTNHYGATFSSNIFDVTDVANCKVKFTVISSSANSRLMGITTAQETGFTFIRLGDT
jgi:hypothetical protein